MLRSPRTDREPGAGGASLGAYNRYVMLGRRSARAALALLLSGASLATEPEPGHEGGLLEFAGARAYSLPVRIEREPPAEPGHCDDLDVTDLRVSVRGERVEGPRTLTLDRERIPTIHALLMDTSGSIRGYRPEIVAAASGHVERLQPRHERAMVVTFDETVVLQQAVTGSRSRLLEAVERTRISSGTAFHDGLYYTLRELEAYPDRPVVVLLTDGVDTTSLHDREDVMRLVRRRPELTIFCIGFNLPPLVGTGPSGLLSTRKFLQRLAASTSGRFFDAPTGSRLDRVYRRIRELLDNEATLTVVDPRPDLDPAPVRVGSRRSGCAIEVLRARPRAPEARPGAAYEDALRADHAYRAPYLRHEDRVVDPACPTGDDGSPREFAELRDGRVVGCGLDVTLDYGLLYDPLRPGWTYLNRWMGLKTRPFEIDVPAPDRLPENPAALADRLAALALLGRDADLEFGRFPVRRHARPYYDHPALFHGRVFFELRGRLARLLGEVPAYRSWLNERLQEEVRRELAAFEERLRRRIPGLDEEGLRVVLAHSDAARAIRERAGTVSEASLQRYLGAWLGDVSAHELFTGWEALRIDRLLTGAAPGAPRDFPEAWRELRRLVELPSYAGVLTLLGLGRAPEGDRIGLWRVVLPRPGWLQVRTGEHRHDVDFAELPLDLVPDEPLGYWLVAELPALRSETAATLFAGGYRTRSVRYELLGRAPTHAPRRAFRRTRVRVSFASDGERPGPARITLVADLRLEENGPSVEVFRVERGDAADSERAQGRYERPGVLARFSR